MPQPGAALTAQTTREKVTRTQSLSVKKDKVEPESLESSDGNEEGMKLLLYEQIPARRLWRGEGWGRRKQGLQTHGGDG